MIPTSAPTRRRRQRAFRRAYTMIEVLVSMATASVLATGLGTTLYVASQTFHSDQASFAEKTKADRTLSHILRDMQTATAFSELTATSAAFTVPDRDGDGQPETLRYAWSGTVGDPITYEHNGEQAVTFIADVQSFNMEYLTRLIEAEVVPRVLFISSQAALPIKDPIIIQPIDPIVTPMHWPIAAPFTGLLAVSPDGISIEPVEDPLPVVISPSKVKPTAGEKERIDQMESWRFTVTVISQYDTAASIASAAAEHDVVYMSAEIDGADIEAKGADISATVAGLAIGIVNEQRTLVPYLGMATEALVGSAKKLYIADSDHFITSGYSVGAITIASSNISMTCINGGEASDLCRLARRKNSGGEVALAVLDAGTTGYDGRSIEGRRVQLPWAEDNLVFSSLNDDGLTIMRRSIQWAAALDGSDTETKTEIPTKIPTDNWWDVISF